MPHNANAGTAWPALHTGFLLGRQTFGSKSARKTVTFSLFYYLLTPSARARPEGTGEVSMPSAWAPAVRGEGECCCCPAGWLSMSSSKSAAAQDNALSETQCDAGLR